MKKPRFSLGSIVMLLATLFVVIGMAAFLTLIAGDGVYERTRAVFGLLADQTEEATATPTGVPTASPMPEITEGPTPSPSPTATPALEPKRLTIAAAGTIYAPKTVRESVQEGTDHYDFMTTFEGLSGALENADLSIVTLETLAAGREKGYGNYNTTPQILDALRAVGMSQYAKKAPHMLSGGQKQRVAIAGVLAMKPDVIILDESTAMLDPSGRREVMNTVHRLNREEGISVVIITHYMSEAATADYMIVMDDGRIAMNGTPREVFTKVDKVRALGLDVPPMTDLAHSLRADGVDVRADVLTVDEMVEEVCRLSSSI